MINFHNVYISKLVVTISAFMLTVLSGCSSAPSAKPGSVLSAPAGSRTNLFRKSCQNMPAEWWSGSATNRRSGSGAATLRKFTSGWAARVMPPANMMTCLSSRYRTRAVSRSKKPLMANPPAVLISRQTRNPWAGGLFPLTPAVSFSMVLL